MRHSARLAKVRPIPGSVLPVGLSNAGPVGNPRRDPPGGGITLGRALGRIVQASTMLGARWNTSTAHGGPGVYRSDQMPSPQRFVTLTTQGAAQSAINVEQTANTIRLTRPARGRNRGRLEP